MAACHRADSSSPCVETQKPLDLGLELMLLVVAVPVVAVLVGVILVVLVLDATVVVVAVLVVAVLVVVVPVLVVLVEVVVPVLVVVVAILVVMALVVPVLDAVVLVAVVLVGVVLVGVVLSLGARVGATPVVMAPVKEVAPEVVPVPTAPLRPVAAVAAGSTTKLRQTRVQLVSARMAILPGLPLPFSEAVETWSYQGGQGGPVRMDVGHIDLVLPSLIVHPLRAGLAKAVASWSYQSAADPTGKVALVEDSCDSVLLAADCILEEAGFVEFVAPAAAGSGVAGHQSLGNGRVLLGCSGVLAVAVADPIVAPASLLALAVGSLVSAHPARKGVAERNPAEVEAPVAARYAG
jgi:hypothetical protein